MNQYSILTKKKMYLDNNVWLVMLATILLCLGLLGYRRIDNKSCAPFTISARGLISDQNDLYDVGETVIFSISIPAKKEVTWQFGDNTINQKAGSATMRHKFLKQGKYTVRAIINEKCNDEITVNIKKPESDPALSEPTNIHAPKIYGDSTPKLGKPQRYLSDAIGNAYEWKIINKSTFRPINAQSASFTFTKPGLYVLQLTVDHDRKKRSHMQINVAEDLAKVQSNKIEKPRILIPPEIRSSASQSGEKQEEKEQGKEQPQPNVQPPKKPDVIVAEPPKRKILFIRAEMFQTKLEGVVRGQNDVQDFDAYLPNSGDTKVLVNNEKKYKTFKELCDEIRGKKKIEIQSVELIRTEDNLVQQLKVKYRKKGIPIIKNIGN